MSEAPKFDGLANEPLNDEEWAAFDTYVAELGITMEDLRGKTVLDLGSGLGEFAEAARKHGVEIISVDAHPEWHDANWEPQTKSPFVVGSGLHLPFKNEAFDTIISRAAVHSIIEVEDDIVPLWGEVLRVLKPGGEFRFGPGEPLPLQNLRQSERETWNNYYEKYQDGSITQGEIDDWNRIIKTSETRSVQINEMMTELEGVKDAAQRAEIMKNFALRKLKAIYPNIEVFDTNSEKSPYEDFSFRMWKPDWKKSQTG